jgi:hypothetical protein
MRRHAVVIALVLSLAGGATIRADQMRTTEQALVAPGFEREPADCRIRGQRPWVSPGGFWLECGARSEERP